MIIDSVMVVTLESFLKVKFGSSLFPVGRGGLTGGG